jgi:hypothetical protein
LDILPPTCLYYREAFVIPVRGSFRVQIVYRNKFTATGVCMGMRNSVLKKPPYAAMACATVLAGASVLMHPFGDVKTTSAKPLLAGADVDPAVVRILEKSCQNCHSERTEWPWYSYVAPMSWLIEKDVHDARSHMNLSRWQEYDAQKRHDLLTEMAAVVRNRRMPLARYTLLHPDAKLSAIEFDRIYQWARAERRRMNFGGRALAGPPASAGLN